MRKFTLGLLAAALAAVGGYYYYRENVAAPVADNPQDAPYFAKAAELFPNDVKAQRKWIAQARSYAEKIAALPAPKSKPDSAKILAQSEELYRFDFGKKLEYVKGQFDALRRIEAYGNDENILPSEYALIFEASAKVSPENYKARHTAALSYHSMFSTIRRAEEDCDRTVFKVIYNRFVETFRTDPNAAFDRFEREYAALKSFNEQSLPPEIDGAREYIASQTSDILGRFDALSRLYADPVRNVDKVLLATRRPDWKNFGKIKDIHRRIAENSVYTAEARGTRYTALYITSGGKNYFAVPAECFPENSDTLFFERNGKRVSATVERIGERFLFYRPNGAVEGAPVRITRLNYTPSSVSAFGSNAYGKIVSLYCSLSGVSDGVLEFYDSGRESFLATESFATSEDGGEVYAMGLRSSAAGKNVSTDEDRFAEIKKAKRPFPTLAKQFRPNFSAKQTVQGGIIFRQLGYEFSRSTAFDRDRDDKLKQQLSELERKNAAVFAALLENSVSSLLSERVRTDFPSLYAVGKNGERFFFGGRKTDAKRFVAGLRYYYSLIQKELERELYEVRKKTPSPFLADKFAAEVGFSEKLVEALKGISAERGDLTDFIPSDVLSGWNGVYFVAPVRKK